MDRSPFATCAAAVLALGALSSLGCESRSSSPASDAPAVLPELQSATPGPWRRLDDRQVVSASAPGNQAWPTDVAERPLRLNPDWHGATPGFPRPEEPQIAERTMPLGRVVDVRRDREEIAPELPELPPPALIPAAAPEGEAPAATDHPVREARPEEPRAAARMVDELPQAPPANWPPAGQRPAAMDVVAARADDHVRQGFRLAERGAMFSARRQFIMALELVAQAYDVQHGTREHTQALSAGLVALKESADFVRPVGRRAESYVSRAISAHKTPLLKGAESQDLSPIVAAQRYYTFAQEQLAQAAAGESCSSMALYGLGKVTITTDGGAISRELADTAGAMALYQAALAADGANFRAANELGVLLAQNGDPVRARDLLVRSVNVSPQPATWQNLAVVHARLGETALAEAAKSQAIVLHQQGVRAGGPAVQWVDPQTFAHSVPASDAVLPPANSTAPQPTAPRQPASVATKKSMSDWLPWNSRR